MIYGFKTLLSTPSALLLLLLLFLPLLFVGKSCSKFRLESSREASWFALMVGVCSIRSLKVVDLISLSIQRHLDWYKRRDKLHNQNDANIQKINNKHATVENSYLIERLQEITLEQNATSLHYDDDNDDDDDDVGEGGEQVEEFIVSSGNTLNSASDARAPSTTAASVAFLKKKNSMTTNIDKGKLCKHWTVLGSPWQS